MEPGPLADLPGNDREIYSGHPSPPSILTHYLKDVLQVLVALGAVGRPVIRAVARADLALVGPE